LKFRQANEYKEAEKLAVKGEAIVRGLKKGSEAHQAKTRTVTKNRLGGEKESCGGGAFWQRSGEIPPGLENRT